MTNLRFEFHCRDELPAGYHDQVPFLLRAVVAWQLQGGARLNIDFLEPRLTEDIGN